MAMGARDTRMVNNALAGAAMRQQAMMQNQQYTLALAQFAGFIACNRDKLLDPNNATQNTVEMVKKADELVLSYLRGIEFGGPPGEEQAG